MDIGLPSRLAEWQWGYPRLPTSSHFLNAPLEESSKGRPEKVGFWVWPNPNLFATANILSPPKCTLLTSLHTWQRILEVGVDIDVDVELNLDVDKSTAPNAFALLKTPFAAQAPVHLEKGWSVISLSHGVQK